MKRAAIRTPFNNGEKVKKIVELEQFHFLEKIQSNFIYSRTIPIRTVSEANSREHWHKKSSRHSMQKMAIKSFLNADKPSIKPPCTIKLTRISPRKMDRMENLPMSFKYIVDAISEYIHPNLAIGRADDDENLHWEYFQEKGLPKEYAIKIEITKNLDS